MIDEEITFREKGYYSTDLKSKSHKPVWAVCEGEDCQREGGRGRWVQFKDYRDLCRLCSMKVPCREKCKNPTEKRKCIDDDITYAEKGYRSTELKPKSNKEVWRVCAGCGEGAWIQFSQYHDLCHKCAHGTDECRRKISENHADVSGKNHPMYGIRHSDKTRALMRENHADVSGENNPNYGVIASDKTRALMRENHADFSGKNSSNWKGGITSWRNALPQTRAYKNWRKAVFERDDYTCQMCDVRGGYLEAHHILPVRDNKNTLLIFDIDNGITLCKECHDKTKGKEYEFVDRFQKIINSNL